MQDISSETVALIERGAPRFIPSVRRALADKADAGIVLTLDAFTEEPELLYACAWYAAVHGVPLHLAPTASPQAL